jgi:hypothetical protein
VGLLYEASLFSKISCMGEIDHDVVLASIKLSDDANVPNDVWPPDTTPCSFLNQNSGGKCDT